MSRKRDPFQRGIMRRVYLHDKDCVVAMCGERGSCKSGSSISLGYDLDVNPKTGESRFMLPESYLPEGFKLREGEVMPRVVFTPSNFLKLLFQENLPAGSVIILDEIGVSGDSREFMSAKNKMLKQTFETVRSRNLILFLTAPTLASFDISLRRSLAYYVKCLGQITNSKGEPSALIKPYATQVDPKEGKIYNKLIEYKPVGSSSASQQRHVIDSYVVRKPPDHLEKPYKRLKQFMQNQLYEKFFREFQIIDDVVDGVPIKHSATPSLLELVELVKKEPEKYFNVKSKTFVAASLQAGLNIEKASLAKQLKQLLDQMHRNTEILVKI